MASSLITISSFICLGSALVVILMRNPVHSVLFLVLSFCSAGVLLLAMGAEFLGLMVLIVYVGAIAVLFLFVVMMLNINLESRGEERKSLTLVGSGIVILTMFCLSLFLPQTGPVPADLLDFQGFGWASLFDGLNSLETLGQILFTKGFLLFLIAGLILLIALVGSIVLTLQTRHDVKKQTVSHQRSRDPENSVFLVDLDPTVKTIKTDLF